MSRLHHIECATAILALNVSSLSFASDADPFRGYDEYANRAIADWGVPGMAVAVVKDGSLIFAKGYGLRNIEDGGAVDKDTVFPIASITKTFNATALAMLVDKEQLGWNDHVVKHLPELELHDDYVTREVTVADLLSHRTCLEDPILLMQSGADRQELMRRARHLRPVTAFRSSCFYNNLMINISGEVLERMTKESWEEFVEHRIFKPLGMASTVADVERLANSKDLATTYVEIGDELRKDPTWNLPLSDGWRRYRQTIRPDGSICSNVDDMAKFLILHLENGQYEGMQLLKKETALEMRAIYSSWALKAVANTKLPYPEIVFGYGLGWEIRDYRGRKLVMHRGSTGAVLAMMPTEKIGLVVLTNLNRGVQYMVMHDTFDRLLGIPRSWTNRDWTSQIVEQERSEADKINAAIDARRDKTMKSKLSPIECAGTYESSLLGNLTVSQLKGGLQIQLGSTDNCQCQLKHWQGDQFRATFQIRHAEDWFVEFGESDSGIVSHVTILDARSGKTIGTFRRTEVN